MADRKRRPRPAFDAAVFAARVRVARRKIAEAIEAVDACSDIHWLHEDVDSLVCYAGNALTCARIVLDVADAKAREGRR